MVSKKVAKKSTARKTAKAVSKKVVGKKVTPKSAPRRAPSLDLNQAIVAEARALLAKRSTGGQSPDAQQIEQILKILAKIAEELHQLIVILSTRGWP